MQLKAKCVFDKACEHYGNNLKIWNLAWYSKWELGSCSQVRLTDYEMHNAPNTAELAD